MSDYIGSTAISATEENPPGLPATIDSTELTRQAAELGVTLTAADERAIAARQRELRKKWELEDEQKTKGQSQFVRVTDNFNRYWPEFLKALLAVGAVFTSFVQTLVVSLVVPVILAVILFVEQQRITHGILLFEVNSGLAYLGAWAMVILNLSLEFAAEFTEQGSGYRQPIQYKASLRSWLSNLAYFVGIAGWRKTWSRQEVSPAKRIRDTQMLVTVATMVLAIGGSMEKAISTTPGNWVTGIETIIQSSTLAQMFSWNGGFLFAIVLVVGVQ